MSHNDQAYASSESSGNNLSDFEEADNLALELEKQEEANESDIDFVADSDDEENETMEDEDDEADLDDMADQVVPQAGLAVEAMEVEESGEESGDEMEESEDESADESEEESGVSDSFVSSSSDI